MTHQNDIPILTEEMARALLVREIRRAREASEVDPAFGKPRRQRVRLHEWRGYWFLESRAGWEGPFSAGTEALSRGRVIAAGEATAEDDGALPLDLLRWVFAECTELLGEPVLFVINDVNSMAGSCSSAVYRLGDRYLVHFHEVGWFGPFTRRGLRQAGPCGLALLDPAGCRNYVSGDECWDFLDCVDASFTLGEGVPEIPVKVAGESMVVRRTADGKIVWVEA